MIHSFEVATNEDLRSFLDQYFAALAIRPAAIGWVYTNGPATYVSTRNRLIRNHIGFRKFDPTRIEFRPGRNIGKMRTDLWIVPPGAKEPNVKPEAWIEVQFGRVYKAQASTKLLAFLASLVKHDGHRAVVINYGSPEQVAVRVRWLRDEYYIRNFDASRITLVNGGPGPARTVMWLVPPGAANPTPSSLFFFFREFRG